MAKHYFGDNLESWFTEVRLEQIDELEARLFDCFGPPANLVRGHIPARVESPALLEHCKLINLMEDWIHEYLSGFTFTDGLV